MSLKYEPWRLAVDIQEVAFAMENAWSTESYLDRETGQIVPLPEGIEYYLDRDAGSLTDWEAELMETARSIRDDPERYVPVPEIPTDEAYEVMQDFALGLNDTPIQQRLLEALAGRGAFSRFRRVIEEDVEVRAQWFTHRDKRYAEIARDWAEQVSIRAWERESRLSE